MMGVTLKLFLAVLFCALVFADENSSNYLPECTSVYCSNRKGFVKENTSSYKFLQWRNRWTTTFVLHIKGNKNNQSKNPMFINVCPSAFKCDQVRLESTDKFLVYRNVPRIIIYRSRADVKYHINYYIGCDIRMENSISIEQSRPLFGARKCWVVIPKVADQNDHMQLESTFALVKNVAVPDHSALTMYNMLEDHLIWSLTSNTAQEASWVKPSHVGMLYQKKYYSTALYFEANKCDLCSTTGFDLELKTLTRNEHSCFKEKQACVYHINQDGKNYNCKNPKYKECRAFDHISFLLTITSRGMVEDFPITTPKITTEIPEKSTINESQKLSSNRRNADRSCWSLYKGKQQSHFCQLMQTSRCARYRSCYLYCCLYRLSGKCKRRISNPFKFI